MRFAAMRLLFPCLAAMNTLARPTHFQTNAALVQRVNGGGVGDRGEIRPYEYLHPKVRIEPKLTDAAFCAKVRFDRKGSVSS